MKTYNNSKGIISPCADPCLLKHEGVYYLYCTSDNNSDIGIPVYKSTDLVNWEGPCGVGPDGMALHKDDVWGEKWFWAGEVIEKNNKFYIYPSVEEHLIAAVSDSPLGPFKQEIKKPMHDFREIDAGAFTDDDGKSYFYFVRFDNANVIFAAEFNDDMISIKEETVTECIRPELPWEKGPYEPEWPVTEGPYTFKRNGVYYLVYTANHFLSKEYSIGYATSKSPLGPWEKYEGSPIIKRSEKVNGPGNGMFIESPDGSELFLAYHVHCDLENPTPRKLAIDRVRFEKNPDGGADIIKVDGPTVDEQPMPK